MTKMLFLLPLALGATVPSLAAEPLPLESRIVATADLDLSTDSGRQVLDRRLARAAADVCGSAADVDLSGRNAVRACKVEALAQARTEASARVAALDTDRPIEVAAR